MNKISFIFKIFFTWICYPSLTYLAQKNEFEIKKAFGDQKRILVIPQLSRIGDIVCSTPVFYNIKNSFPNSYLTVLISKKAYGILKNNPRIDSFIFIEDYPGFNLIKKLRAEKFNWSISLSATSTSTYWVTWSYIANRVKTIVENPPITEILTDWMANHRLLYKNHTYLPEHHTNLLNFMGINNPIDRKEVFLSNLGENKASIYIKSLNLNPQTKIVGMSITAGNKIKELGDGKFAELAKKILDIGNTAIICIGSKNNNDRLDNFVKKVGNPQCFFTTDFTLEELPSLMKLFSLYIAVDTGPIYIAETLEVPLIDIIGPVDPSEQPPENHKSIRVLPRNNIEPSSFVFKRRGSESQIKKALDNTYVLDIYDAAIKLLR